MPRFFSSAIFLALVACLSVACSNNGQELFVSEAVAASSPSEKRIADLEASMKKLSERLDRLERNVGSSFGSAGWDSVSKRLDNLESAVRSLRK